jgi:hypothetical protein
MESVVQTIEAVLLATFSEAAPGHISLPFGSFNSPP